MNIEIERKFLVKEFDVKKAIEKIKIKQGYISSQDGKVVRVRTFNDKAFLQEASLNMKSLMMMH